MHNQKVKEIVEALEISVEELNYTIHVLKECDKGFEYNQPYLEELSRKVLNADFSKIYARLNELYIRLYLIGMD